MANLVSRQAALSLGLALLVCACALLRVVQASPQFAPSVNQGGVWIPNPVQQVRQEIHHKVNHYSPRQMIARERQKMKQDIINSIPMGHKIQRLENKLLNIRNALRN